MAQKGCKPNQTTLSVLHGLAVVVHVTLTILMATLDWFEPLRSLPRQELTIPGWDRPAGDEDALVACPQAAPGGGLKPYVLVELFNATTALAHLVYFILSFRKEGKTGRQFYPFSALNAGRFVLRWIEYSLTATAMIYLILLQTGIRELFVYLSSGLLTVLVMVTGGLFPQWAELKARKVIPWQIFSWVLLILSWLPIWISTASNLKDAPDDTPKGLIRAIVTVETLFFASFGILEFSKTLVEVKNPEERKIGVESNVERLLRKGENETKKKKRKQCYAWTELLYIVLSVVSKSTLIFLVAASLNQMPEFYPPLTCEDFGVAPASTTPAPFSTNSNPFVEGTTTTGGGGY